MITTINEFKLINEDRSFKVVAKDRKHLDMLIRKNMEKFGVNCDLNYIDVSQIDDLENIFYLNNYFTGDISNWDVSKVTHMNSIFDGAPIENDPPDWYLKYLNNIF